MNIRGLKQKALFILILLVSMLAFSACTSSEQKRDRAIEKIDQALSKKDRDGVKEKSISNAYELLKTIPEEYSETISIQKRKIDKAYYDRKLYCCYSNSSYIYEHFDEIYNALGAKYILDNIGIQEMPKEIEHVKIWQFDEKMNSCNNHNKKYNKIIDLLLAQAISEEDFTTANTYIQRYAPYYEIASRKFIKKDNGFFGDGKDIFNYKTKAVNSAQNQAKLRLDCVRLVESIEDDFNMAKFSRGSAMINEHAREALDRLYILMKKNDGISVKFIGHTSVDGTEEANLTLSRERAKSAAKYLERKGIKFERLGYEGKGSSQLRNQSDPTSEENCRIDIVLL